MDTRNEQIELLEKYTLFLQKNGYIDTDATCEEPFAIDEFMKTIATLKLSESKQQLPVVKDWDEVFKDYFDNERNTGSDHNLIDFLKQNYSLKVSPSDEVLKIWLKSFVFDALRCQTQEIDELVNAGIPNLRTLFSEVK